MGLFKLDSSRANRSCYIIIIHRDVLPKVVGTFLFGINFCPDTTGLIVALQGLINNPDQSRVICDGVYEWLIYGLENEENEALGILIASTFAEGENKVNLWKLIEQRAKLNQKIKNVMFF